MDELYEKDPLYLIEMILKDRIAPEVAECDEDLYMAEGRLDDVLSYIKSDATRDDIKSVMRILHSVQERLGRLEWGNEHEV